MKKTILISGAGSGIGRSICQKLDQDDNYQLVLIGRNKSSLSETLSELKNKQQHTLVEASVFDKELLKKSFHKIELDKKNVYAVLANAGLGGNNYYDENDRWQEIIDVNLTGVYNLVNEALPYMQRSSDNSTKSFRHVILTASLLSHMGVPDMPAYCASKTALLGLMRSWATHWANDNILVNTVSPGWVDTAMARTSIQLMADESSCDFDEAFKQQMDLVPLKKWAQPSEVANLVNFLISPEQISITGEEIQINNGAMMT